MQITHCLTNHLRNPLGYAMQPLSFSWQVENARGERLRASRLTVALTPDMANPIHDTGWTELDSRGTAAELDLQPRTRYYWQVESITDAEDAARSDVQWFETAKEGESWQAQWITCDNDERRHPVFHKQLPLEKQVASARLYICGLGLYEAYINGDRVGDEEFAPYCNAYDHWLQYQTYDVTDALQKGGDVEIHLGRGWYNGRYSLVSIESGMAFYSQTWKLIAEVRVRYADGTEGVFGTDESWTVTRDHITASSIYDGEHVDDTLPELPAVPAQLCGEELSPLTARYSIPVRRQERMKPLELIRTPKGETVLDIGQNHTGIFELEVEVPLGQEVYLQFGEVLQNGCFYRDNLRSAQAEYRYVSDGRRHVLCPRYTFYGYRYVKVEGVENLRKEDYTAIALYSDLPETGKIHTGHALVNQLISNAHWGLKSNYLDVPTDCPQRDERMGWTGDAQVFSATASFFRDSYAFMRKYLKDMAEEQAHLGGRVPHVVPAAGLHDCSSVWGDAACIIPWNLYLFYGDKAILAERYEDMKAWVEYIRKVDGDDHGWRRSFHFGDWLALDNPSNKVDEVLGGTDHGLIGDVYYRNSALIVAKAARLLCKEDEAAHYEELADTILRGIREEYFSATGRCCVDTQTAHLLTLRYGLTDTPERAKAALVHALARVGNTLQTGFVGTPHLNNILSEMGRGDLAYHLLLNESYPGWLYEINLGATTVWERWNSILPDGSISSTGMNSLNHYAYGAIVEWMFRWVAGIAPREDAPGFASADLCPTPCWALRHAEAEVETASGKWQVAWEMPSRKEVTIRATVPFGCTGYMKLPFAPAALADASNSMLAHVEKDVCVLSHGCYEISYPLDLPDDSPYISEKI